MVLFGQIVALHKIFVLTPVFLVQYLLLDFPSLLLNQHILIFLRLWLQILRLAAW